MRIGTIGTGFIVERFLRNLTSVADAECLAMYSRKVESAKPLSEQFGIGQIYTDFDELMSDERLDFIYVASPNSLHFEHTKQALLHGKNVICEKPFTSTVAETEYLIALAKEKDLMLFEAITTFHLPNYQLIGPYLKDLGQLKLVQCNYSQYSSRYTKLMAGELPNVFNPDFSGGALSDINIYNLHFVVGLFGAPQTTHYFANKHENGIDTSGIVVMTYDDFLVECVGAKDSASKSHAIIQGVEGYIEVENGANSCDAIHVYSQDDYLMLDDQAEENMYYELARFKQIYDHQDLVAHQELLEHSLQVMQVYEAARQSAGIVFKADK